MKLYEDWPELVAVIVLVISFVLSMLTRYSVTNYVVVFLGGGIFGHMYFRQREYFKNEVIILAIGFFIGYVLGNFYNNVGASLVLFACGAGGSYYIHKNKYIVCR